MSDTHAPVSARLPPALIDAIDATAAQEGVTRAEMIKAVLEGYFFGTTDTLVGADAGYLQARRLATRIAYATLSRAARELPDDLESALEMLKQQQA